MIEKKDPSLHVQLSEQEKEALAEEAFQKLKEALSYINKEEFFEKLQKAYHYAKDKHAHQSRHSGEPYILHPLAVAEILAEFRVDPSSLIAAVLHDVVEDTDTPLTEIEEKFGKVVASLVDGLTKIGKIKFSSKEERMAENFRKMILAMAKDFRVILVKLADRLHNMRTLKHLSIEKRKRVARETLDIYAPLANRLGIYGIKSELEDLCLKQLEYTIYKEIATNLAAKKKEREAYIEEIKEILETELHKYGFTHAKIYGRPKHIFSIYRKMVGRQLAFKDVHDLFGFRIVLSSIKECYEALGIVHSMWKPMPGRFKDYIAMPKENLYQSLHTTVVRQNGMPAEIQIRTSEMNSICEFGIAAHWSYKEKNRKFNANELEKFSWLKQMIEMQNDLKDPNEFLDALKVDLFDDEIFVFTPKGDVKQLTAKSTAIDFAFAVHSDVGSKTVGVKVNGRMVPLRWKLNSGDIVEVITSKTQKPSKDWLNFAVSSKARNKIRSFLRQEQRASSRKIGKDLLTYELSKKQMSLDKIILNKKIELLLTESKENNYEDLLLSIGYGKINTRELIGRTFFKKEEDENENDVSQQITPDKKENSNKKSSGVLVSGLDNILVSFGKCCGPIPGEDIIGFITRGRGVSIHNKTCAKALDLDPKRKIDVAWTNEEEDEGNHTVLLQVITGERKGVLADVTAAISGCGANIKKAQVRLSPDHTGILDFELALNNLEQFKKVLRVIQAIPDIIYVERRNKVKKR